MNITITTTTLQRALRDISVVLKTSAKVIESPVVQLQVENNSLKLSTRNSSTTFVADMTFEGEPQAKLTAALAPTPFMPYVAELTADKTTIQVSDGSLTITTETDKAVFSLMRAEFFWESLCKNFNGNATIRTDALQDIRDALCYVPLKPTDPLVTPVTMSINLAAKEGKLTASATSNIRIARITRPIVTVADFDVSLCALDFKTFVALAGTIKQEFIDLYFSGVNIGFGGAVQDDYEIAVLTQLLAAPFPAIDTLLEKEKDAQSILIDRDALLSALNKVQLVLDGQEKQTIVTRFGETSVMSASTVKGEITATLPLSCPEAIMSANLELLMSSVKNATQKKTLLLKLYPENEKSKQILFLKDSEDDSQIHALALVRGPRS